MKINLTNGLGLFALSLFSLAFSTARAQEVVSGSPEDVAITVYNQNFGVVREKRRINLKSGTNFLSVEDVASTIDPTSVSFSSLTSPNETVVREQNYRYDLVDPQTILFKSVGKNIKLRQYFSGGTSKELSGVLLSSPRSVVGSVDGSARFVYSGLVLGTASGVILNPAGEIEISEMPEGLVSVPSLFWKLDTEKSGEQLTELSYQASGLNWNCDYVAVLNETDTKADLTSWVTIDNKSGATYKNASLKLMAGDVHRVTQPNAPRSAEYMEMAADGIVGGAQFSEKAFAEYHLYTLKGKTTVANNETKQMSLFNATAVPVKKVFVFDPGGQNYNPYMGSSENPQKVNVEIELENKESNHLGMPMPKGKVRVYKKDQDGSLQFVGEDSLDHTPRDEKIRLYIGDAFDLVGERKQLSVRQISERVQRISYEISLRNHKNTAVTINAVEHASGQWKILNSSMTYTKKDSGTFEFAAQVPARGELKISYEIELKY